jgi:acetylornithine/N-succinyldiaminopimelate aminotransferase
LSLRVEIKSFNGTLHGSGVVDPQENYWLLIGKTGRIVAQKNERQRLLIHFDVSICSIGLHCHNPVENTLFILESDLKFLD